MTGPRFDLNACRAQVCFVQETFNFHSSEIHLHQECELYIWPLTRPTACRLHTSNPASTQSRALGPKSRPSNSDKPNMTAFDRQPDHIEGMRCKAPKRRTPQREWTSKLEPVSFSRHTCRCRKQQSWMASASS